MLFFDIESVGLTGPCVTIQYAENDGPITIHEVWRIPVRDTLKLVERLAEHAGGVCGFNIVFDWFHIQRIYCVLRLLPLDAPPTPEGWKEVERRAVYGPCVKPQTALDLMLHARKGPFQSLMARDDIKIRRVPKALAPILAEELRSRVDLDPIYFAKRKDGYQWNVDDHDGNATDFPDVTLRWGAAGGLKPLARHVLGVEAQDFPVENQFQPKEDTWNPFGDDWLRVIKYHVAFWWKNERARTYAANDVEFTRGLCKAFGSPPPGDDDSILACQVASSRWRGYALNLELLAEIGFEAAQKKEAAPRAPKTVLYELKKRCSAVEALAIEDSTKETLQEIAGTFDGAWRGGWGDSHPAVPFARSVVEARSAEKEEDTCIKLLTTKRAHFDFKITGTLSNRMAGAGGINPQGIQSKRKGSRMREAFILADGELPELDGGDFESFEVTIAAAVYNDEKLIADLQGRDGKGRKIKMHALYGASMFDQEYDDVRENAERYDRSKKGFLATLYGAQEEKLSNVLNLEIELTREGLRRFEEEYPGVGRARARIAEKFCSMRQPGGIGSRVEWHEPADSVESLFGFRRYFSLENKLCRILFDLAQNPPDTFRALKKIKVQRRAGRYQTPGGAAQSALYAAAFGIQAANMRAASNHEIQSSGAHITKRLQRRIWDQQPSGIHPWCVQPLNCHDELEVPRAPSVALKPIVSEVVESFRKTIPLIGMEWKSGLRSWAEKG